MTRHIWITLGVLVLILILAFKQVGKEPPVEKPSKQAQNVQEQEEPVSEPIVSQSGNVKVSKPAKDEQISSPLVVEGEIKSGTAVLAASLKDESGKVIVEKEVKPLGEASGDFSSFSELLFFENVRSGAAALEIGSGVDQVIIPLRF